MRYMSKRIMPEESSDKIEGPNLAREAAYEAEKIQGQSSADESAREVKAPSAAPMLVRQDNSQIIIRDQAELYRVIMLMTKGCAIHKSLDTIEKRIACWQMATALKVRPEVAISNMYIVNGVISLWGQLPKALAHETGELQHFKLIRYNEKQDEIALQYKNLETEVWGAAVQIRRGGGALNEYIFTMEDAKRAGLASKSGPWKDYRPIMLCRRTVGQAIKFDFPDAVMGLGISEYDHNEAPDLMAPPKDVTPGLDRSATLNARFNKPGESNV
jgi:hypothetical protein